jgi:HEPN domain-containing protein
MSVLPEIVEEVRRWIEKAENDFRNAEYVMRMERDCPYDTVCYHCQQCVEKYLKALLIYRSVDFPRTHDIIVLFNMLKNTDSSKLDIGIIQPLNRYSIEARYPGHWDPIGREEAENAITAARSFRVVARKILDKLSV